MRLYVSLTINLDILFPNTIKACKIFQSIFLVDFSYINDSVVVSQNKNQSKNKQKDAPSLSDKVFQMKKQKLDVCKPRVCWFSGDVLHIPKLMVFTILG